MTLDKLPVGQTRRIAAVGGQGALRRRLLELQPLLRQCRQLAQVTAHYYDRSDRSHDASRL